MQYDCIGEKIWTGHQIVYFQILLWKRIPSFFKQATTVQTACMQPAIPNNIYHLSHIWMVQCSWRRRRRRRRKGRRRERLKMRSKNISLSDNPCGNIWSVAPSWAAGASSIKKKTWEFQQQQQLATTTAKRLMTIKKCGLSIMWHTILMPGAKIRLSLSVCLSVCWFTRLDFHLM